MEKKLTSDHEISDHVKFCLILEGKMQRNDEGRLHLLKYRPFSFCMGDLIFFLDKFLLENLHGIEFFCLFKLNEHNFAKGAAAQHFYEIEIL